MITQNDKTAAQALVDATLPQSAIDQLRVVDAAFDAITKRAIFCADCHRMVMDGRLPAETGLCPDSCYDARSEVVQ